MTDKGVPATNPAVATALEESFSFIAEHGLVATKAIIASGKRAGIAILALPMERNGQLTIPDDAVFIGWEDELLVTEARPRATRPGERGYPGRQVQGAGR